MNSCYWCLSLWGLLSVWTGKWWWVNWSTPESHRLTKPDRTHTRRFQVFPCDPASWAPALPAITFLRYPCQSFLCSPTLFLYFLCHSVFITLFVWSSLLVLSVMPCPWLTWLTPPNKTRHAVSTRRKKLHVASVFYRSFDSYFLHRLQWFMVHLNPPSVWNNTHKRTWIWWSQNSINLMFGGK